MPDFLSRMVESSTARARAARARESEASQLARALASPLPTALTLDARGFDLIAEVKRRAPSAGTGPLAADDGPALAVARAAAYAWAGVAAISILTEPHAFAGSLEDLAAASRAVRVPTLRKDFLVDPYQVLEARTAGASGVLLILGILDDARLSEMLDAAARTGLFVLLEAFDERDLGRAGNALVTASPALRILVGLNARDLATLAVDPSRLERIRAAFPAGATAVAESGLETPDDARTAARLGYRLALVGGALMRATDPRGLAERMIEAGREEAKRCASA